MASQIKQTLSAEVKRVKDVQVRNLKTFKQQPWKELSGAFGDIGTFIPIFIALTNNKVVSTSSTLVFSGLANVLTGLYFGIPLPVQPMKAIAAVAIAKPGDWTPARYSSAGLFVAAVVGFLSATGLVQWFHSRVPTPIVKGIQVGTGLSLIISGFSKLPLSRDSWRYGDGPSAAFTAVVVLLFFLFCSTRPRLPFVLIIVLVLSGIGITAVVVTAVQSGWTPSFTIWHPEILVPNPTEFGYGALNAGLGQIPLTTLNSIIAVVYLADDLLPEAPSPSATAVGSSVAMMNLVGCWFKAMPVCHGSGGLAAQYRFGARSGSSIILLGLLKIVLGLFASQFILEWCQKFPSAILGIFLILAGVALVRMGEKLNDEGARDLWKDDGTSDRQFVQPDNTERLRRYLVMTLTVGAILATNDGIGFLVGLVVHYAYKFQNWDEARQEGLIRLENEVPTESS